MLLDGAVHSWGGKRGQQWPLPASKDLHIQQRGLMRPSGAPVRSKTGSCDADPNTDCETSYSGHIKGRGAAGRDAALHGGAPRCLRPRPTWRQRQRPAPPLRAPLGAARFALA